MKTTLNAIRKHSPCTSGWTKLLKNLGKTQADDAPLAITTILESNGLDDALWCLRAVDGHDREIRLYAVECARSVQHLITDKRSINAIDVADRYANGLATLEELDAAREAAWAAGAAAWDAEAAGAAARAAWAAWDAVGAAVCAAAWGAARAAGAAARDAWATRAAGAAAWDAAWDAEAAAEDAQANLLILVCNGCFS